MNRSRELLLYFKVEKTKIAMMKDVYCNETYASKENVLSDGRETDAGSNICDIFNNATMMQPFPAKRST